MSLPASNLIGDVTFFTGECGGDAMFCKSLEITFAYYARPSIGNKESAEFLVSA